MGVVNLPSGQPTLRLTGGAAERLKAILPAGTEAFIHLTITDETPLAQAFVVIEARPRALTSGRRRPSPEPASGSVQFWRRVSDFNSIGAETCTFRNTGNSAATTD